MPQQVEVNNAIERLLDPSQEFDREAAMQIVEFMKPVEFLGCTIKFTPQKRKRRITGFTQEQGNVTIEDDKSEAQTYSFGDKQKGIGRYNLRKFKKEGLYFCN